jgi:hypothetical protein
MYSCCCCERTGKACTTHPDIFKVRLGMASPVANRSPPSELDSVSCAGEKPFASTTWPKPRVVTPASCFAGSLTVTLMGCLVTKSLTVLTLRAPAVVTTTLMTCFYSHGSCPQCPTSAPQVARPLEKVRTGYSWAQCRQQARDLRQDAAQVSQSAFTLLLCKVPLASDRVRLCAAGA